MDIMREIATDAFLIYFIVWYLPSLILKQFNTVVKKWKNPGKHTLDLRNKDSIFKKARQRRANEAKIEKGRKH